MRHVIKRRVAYGMVFVSTGLEVIALGRQEAWRAPLNRWLCEPNERPPIPGILESIMAAGAAEWFAAVIVPLLLGIIFLSASRTKTSLLFWLPLLSLHLLNRFDALDASMQPWGACGLKRDQVFGALLVDIATVFVAALGAGIVAVIVFIMSRWTRRKHVQDT